MISLACAIPYSSSLGEPSQTAASRLASGINDEVAVSLAISTPAVGMKAQARPSSSEARGKPALHRARAPPTAVVAPGSAGHRSAMWNQQWPARRPSTRHKHGVRRHAVASAVDAAAPPAPAALSGDGVLPESDGTEACQLDPMLRGHVGHLRYRHRQFVERRALIDAHEGGLLEFAKGYEKMGFIRANGAILYREWAPAASAATLIGDFNSWEGWKHAMTRDQFGVWEVTLPDVDGHPAIPHGSRVKVRLQKPDGAWVDRVPAWIKYATTDPGKFGATYDGVYWDPAPGDKYRWKHSPPPPLAPRIYEAHVGMSSPEPRVASYVEFAENVLPRIKEGGYNTVQLMAVMEHSYYGSFGYHVTNFFAVSSRSGTPEELKYLVDTAHGLGLRVLMDVVHSHASNNASDGLNGFDFGQSASDSYFHAGERGYQKLWDSRLFKYDNWEVQRFLLSNLRWWMDEYHFDGFRFDGVTSMLYQHHGIHHSFSGDYHEYFSESTDVDAVVYLMLANELIHCLRPGATTVAEDVSGMPTLSLALAKGGVGFDYRLAMAIPDRWIDFLKNRVDEEWSMSEVVSTLTNRRYTERAIAYAESHDQSMVGDKSFAFLLMDREMYTGMSALQEPSPVVQRGIALHKLIHLLTMALGGDGYLNFMGAEFGHPEWVDFPREGNDWSYDKCRRRYDLADETHLRYKFMLAFDRRMMDLDEKFHFLSSPHQLVSCASEGDKMVVVERGPLVFIFNFHPVNTYSGYKVGVGEPGKYRVTLDSDAWDFGGQGRVAHDVDHFTSPEGEPGKPETNFNNRPCSILVLSPSRTCQVYCRIPEDESTSGSDGDAGEEREPPLLAYAPEKLGPPPSWSSVPPPPPPRAPGLEFIRP